MFLLVKDYLEASEPKGVNLAKKIRKPRGLKDRLVNSDLLLIGSI